MHPGLDQLHGVYDSFEADAASFKAAAACSKGCAFCCTDAGSIHITTLEGLSIEEALSRLAKTQRQGIRKAMARDMRRRQKGLASPCPFLMKNHACAVYAQRPFACRRIYSIQICSKTRPPTLSRQVMAQGDLAIKRLQELDHTGYSGHLTFILHMLASPRFRSTYLAGEFKPQEVSDFGRSHRIIINRTVAGPAAG